MLDDVRNGYVSAEAARDQYGVIVDPARMVVLSDETAARRAGMKKAGDGRMRVRRSNGWTEDR